MYCSNVTLLFFVDVPSPPRNLHVKTVTESSVTLEWSAPDTTGGADLLGYPVERRDATKTTWIRVTRLERGTTHLTIDNLLEGRGYLFRVFAENIEGLSQPAITERPVMPERPIGEYLASHCVVELEISL